MKARLALVVITLLGASGFAFASKPNVVIILVDDMGYGDVAAHGNPVSRTPQLDRLHAESARLTDFHVDPTCSPTRSAILTGKYSHHVKVWHTIAGGNHLRAGELTMADAFRANGYRTAMFGKWHLGSNLPYRPIDRGFDEWLGQGDGGTGTTDDYFFNDRVNDHFLHNGEWERHDGWAEDVFFNAAMDFIRASKKADKPFYIHLATYSPHMPITLPDRVWAAAFKGKVDANEAFFYAAIERIDEQIGKLRTVLDETGAGRDTILIYLTDNGGTLGVETFNSGMRGNKGDAYDGGHRVPCFIHWPSGGLRKGEDVSTLAAHIDLFPTLIEFCDLKLPHAVDFDGRSLATPLRNAKAKVPDRTLIVERQRTYTPKKWDGAAAMTSRWRLVNDRELYDIKQDPEQKNNVIDAHPDVAAALRNDFDAYWKKVSPGDRDRAEFIVGDKRDAEIFLHPSDWYRPDVPWHHARVAAAPDEIGDWHIRAAQTATYRFEIHRWPREADAAITGTPEFPKTTDAWDANGLKPSLLYGSERTIFRKLPITSARLTVGTTAQTLPVNAGATSIAFNVKLENGQACSVKSEFLDAADKVIAAGYYVYCTVVDH